MISMAYHSKEVENMSMIELKDITKIYNVGDEDVRALDSVNLSIERGEFMSIIGPSGSGKSTLMNILGCLDVADSGSYLLDGMLIERYTDNQLAQIRNEKIGFIFQSFNLLSRMTAQENIELPLIYQGMRPTERKKRVEEVLERVELTSRRRHNPTELSGGQQQRVAIARALVTHPSILLADEPTGNLDSRTGNEIIQLFHELHEGDNTIILITHDEKIAEQAKRTVHILDGKLSEVAR